MLLNPAAPIWLSQRSYCSRVAASSPASVPGTATPRLTPFTNSGLWVLPSQTASRSPFTANGSGAFGGPESSPQASTAVSEHKASKRCIELILEHAAALLAVRSSLQLQGFALV